MIACSTPSAGAAGARPPSRALLCTCHRPRAPAATVEEFNPATNTWRTVASLPTAVAQFGITAAGGINTAEPIQLVHVVSGNTGTESVPSVANANPVQRFQADPAGPGTWSAF